MTFFLRILLLQLKCKFSNDASTHRLPKLASLFAGGVVFVTRVANVSVAPKLFNPVVPDSLKKYNRNARPKINIS